jgi:phosphosulfolactate synthase
LIPQAVLQRIVRLYREAAVTPYAGGILFEYAYRRGAFDAALDLLTRIGIPSIEISENYVALSDAERARFIEAARSRGFSVVYEFGRKHPSGPLEIEDLATAVSQVTALGATHVIVEQSEIVMLQGARPGVLRDLMSRDWFEGVIIEADPYCFPEQHAALILECGSEVSLANVAPGQVLRLENLRRGVGRAVDYRILKDGEESPGNK